MTLTLVMTGMEMTLPPQTPLPKEKENLKVLNMSMYSKDPLDQKVRRVNLDKQDGRDGQNFTLTKELEETLKAH